jgi:hypothetical protein
LVLRSARLARTENLAISSDVITRTSAILGLAGLTVVHCSQVVATIERTAWLGVAIVV